MEFIQKSNIPLIHLLAALQAGERCQTGSTGRESRCTPGWMCPIWKAGRGHEEQILDGEPQVHDCHGRRRVARLRSHLLEVFHGSTRTGIPLPTPADATPTSSCTGGSCSCIRRFRWIGRIRVDPDQLQRIIPAKKALFIKTKLLLLLLTPGRDPGEAGRKIGYDAVLITVGPQLHLLGLGDHLVVEKLVAQRKVTRHVNRDGNNNLGHRLMSGGCWWGSWGRRRVCWGIRCCRRRQMRSSRFHAFPLCAAILKPYFYLNITESQSFGQFRSLVQGQVLLWHKFLF